MDETGTRLRGYVETTPSKIPQRSPSVTPVANPPVGNARALSVADETLMYKPAYDNAEAPSQPPHAARNLAGLLDAAHEQGASSSKTLHQQPTMQNRIFDPSVPLLQRSAPSTFQHYRQLPLSTTAASTRASEQHTETQHQHLVHQGFQGIEDVAADPDYQLLHAVWALPVFELSLRRLSTLAGHMLAGTGQQPNIVQAHLLKLLAESVVLQAHADLPRHDGRHAVLQLHFCWRVLTATGAHQHMPHLSQLALLVAALCSHINHCGLTSEALDELDHPLATRYAAALCTSTGAQHDSFGGTGTLADVVGGRAMSNGSSNLLQHHHCAVTVGLLGSPSHDILHAMPCPQARDLRMAVCSIISCISDNQHFSLMAAASNTMSVNHHTSQLQARGLELLKSSQRSCHLFSCLLARCSQLLRFYLPWDVSKHLAELEEQEQRLQAQMLAQHTRTAPQAAPSDLRSRELALLNTHAAPALEVLAVFMGDAARSLTTLFNNLSRNRAILQALIKDAER